MGQNLTEYDNVNVVDGVDRSLAPVGALKKASRGKYTRRASAVLNQSLYRIVLRRSPSFICRARIEAREKIAEMTGMLVRGHGSKPVERACSK